MNNKTVLRINAKELRKTLDMKSVSENLVQKIREHEVYKHSKHVMLFYPTKYEVNLLNLLEDDKKFYFPRVKETDLLVCPYDKSVRLEKSDFNILEPCSNPVRAKVLDLIVVPALMVDKEGYRLGYGGGFYDRFLSALEDKIPTMCPIPKELFTEQLPHDCYDIAVDITVKTTL